jgi:hypothetical protein
MKDDYKPPRKNQRKSKKLQQKVDPKVAKEKFENKLSTEDLVNRKLEAFEIFHNSAEFIITEEQRREKLKAQKVELQNGDVRSVDSFLTEDVQPYQALFPNSSEFFRQLYRVAAIIDRDPDDYDKPPIIPILINEIIYRRFGAHAPKALRAKAIVNGHRRHKFSQYLDPDGKDLVRQYRDEAIVVAKEFQAGQLYEFRLAYAERFKIEGQQFKIHYKY